MRRKILRLYKSDIKKFGQYLSTPALNIKPNDISKVFYEGSH